MPGRGTTLPGNSGERSDEHRRTRRRAPGGSRGPVTLPSQGRVHRSPRTSRSSPFSNTYKILTSHKLQQIGGGGLPPICAICGKSKFYKYLDRGSLQVARKRGTTLPGSLERPRSDEHRRTRKERLLEVPGTGDPLPSQGQGPRNLQELSPFSNTIKF